MLTSTKTTPVRATATAAIATARPLALAFLLLVPALHAAETRRVSVDSKGKQATGGFADQTAFSGHGRYVAFDSDLPNLVEGDGNGMFDVFVHDRKKGTTTRVSLRTGGAEPLSGDSFAPAISANGRFVAFWSAANDLVEDDNNQRDDIFLHDRKKGTTRLVSVSSSGEEASDRSNSPAISANGRFIAFESDAKNLVPDDTNNVGDVFVHDRKTGQTTRVSVDSDGVQANGMSFSASVSKDGRFIAFESAATNLVPGDTNGRTDVFVHDRKTGATERISVDSDESQATGGDSGSPSISDDGRFVAFSSRATNLVAGDSNGKADIFLRDRKKGITARVSVDSTGAQANGDSSDSAISGDGRYIAFETAASNLFASDTNGQADIAIHDRKKHTTTAVSVSTGGTLANSFSYYPSISGDGRSVAFASNASNLVENDTNAETDTFVRDLD